MTLTLHSYFKDHAVIQKDKEICIFGTAEPFEKIKISFADDKKETKCDSNSYWEVYFDALPESGPYELYVSSDSKEIKLKDIVVADLWLFSGQSNMAFKLSESQELPELDLDKYEQKIRFFNVSKKMSFQEYSDIHGKWKVFNSTFGKECSALAYFFSSYLLDKVEEKKFIGILNASIGHTPIESWIPDDAIVETPELEKFVRIKNGILEKYEDAEEKHREYIYAFDEMKRNNELEDDWYAQSLKLKQAGKDYVKRDPREGYPMTPGNPWVPSLLYNGMIHPLHKIPVKGIVWYQGETNAILESSSHYAKMLNTLIESWRNRWGEKLPFYYVQLANHSDVQCLSPDEHWATLRIAQSDVENRAERVYLSSAIDLGESYDIHPKSKKEIAERLARTALDPESNDCIHPRLCQIYQDLPNYRVEISHTKNLKVVGNAHKLLEIETEKDVWVAVLFQLNGNEIIFNSNDKVLAVRYAYSADPKDLLYGDQNLPVLPFRVQL